MGREHEPGATVIKDSGVRQHYDSGMVRDTQDGKTDYSLALDGPMFERYARHLTEGAKKYAKRNWMKACSHEELERFKGSALRHFIQWFRGDLDEDHAAATFFNINAAEYVKTRLELRPPSAVKEDRSREVHEFLKEHGHLRERDLAQAFVERFLGGREIP